MSPFWTCVRTHPNSEKIAIRNLQNQEFIYYQPLILEKKLRKQKLVQVEQPLFPCYLFVRVVDKWRSLNSTHGVAALIPGQVRDCIIDDLKMREENGYIQLPKSKPFEVGDKVTIQAGPFQGHEALVERMSVKDRQKILLGLLANKISVLINETDIERAA